MRAEVEGQMMQDEERGKCHLILSFSPWQLA